MFSGQDPPNPSSRSCIAAAMKGVFSHCRTFGRKIEEKNPYSDSDDDSDNDNAEQVVVSAIRSKAIEAMMRRKTKTSLTSDSFKSDTFSRVFSHGDGKELFASPNKMEEDEDGDGDGDGDEEDYFSVKSYLSHTSSSATSREGFLSVKTNFSRCSSLSGVDFCEIRSFRRPSIIQELLCQCEGWPFGLCRRALLLPPLPKSPSESWSWRKGKRVTETK